MSAVIGGGANMAVAPTAAPARSGVHVPALDAVRGIAILLVACHNMQMLDRLDTPGISHWLQHALNWGWVGVTLFFVLSGHLIAGILLDTVSVRGAVRRFFVRRALRIFPLYFGLLAVSFWLLPALNLQPAVYAADAPHQGWYWLFLSNWAEPMGWVRGALPHLWSLGVEEQFYLVLPWLVLAWPRPRTVFWGALAVAVACMASRAVFWAAAQAPETVYHWTIFRVDALALGVCTAALQRDAQLRAWFASHSRWLHWLLWALLLGGAVLTRGYPRLSMWGQTVGFSILAVWFAHIVHRASLVREPGTTAAARFTPSLWERLLAWQTLQRAGWYSYGFYIVHKPLHDAFSPQLFHWLTRHTPFPLGAALLHLALMTAASFALATVTFRLVERPFLRLKDRWAP